ncbi:MAG: GTPase Era [Chitinophagales bacterium]|nr:GTPase Era [Chitinophagales bacterium]MCZ2393291.1 GTPase Era [Chitinophagales bacterium]
MKHFSGFINILGKPNVGKSTLMNALIGEKLSIITSKAQTTRHRIFGILNGDNFQMVISDLPGIIDKPAYKMQESMMDFVKTSLEDADAFIYMVEAGDKVENQPEEYQLIKKMNIPVLLIINKIDIIEPSILEEWVELYAQDFPHASILPISALEKANVNMAFDWMMAKLPEGEPYFDKDQFTDKPERFFVTEIIREKILQNYTKEIPYSCEVVVESFKEEEDIIRIAVVIYVERDSQKPIVIGKGGSMIKKVGMEARKDMEIFFQKKIFLETYVKVLPNWRNNDRSLRSFGYKE